jgi:SAM-dependent methyltransferase
MNSKDVADIAPPPVSRMVRWLSIPWMFWLRTTGRRRLKRPVFEHVKGRYLAVWPNVFNPVVFRTGRYFAEFLSETPLLEPEGDMPKAVLDIGTGSGIHAVIAATRGCRVTAVDIEPGPVACAHANAALNGVGDRLRVFQGDLFAPVQGETFDVVLGSLPSFRGLPTTPFERAWKSPDIFERFAAGVPAVLRPGGVVLFVMTSHGDPYGHLAALAREGFAIERLTWRHFGAETMAIYAARISYPRVCDT